MKRLLLAATSLLMIFAPRGDAFVAPLTLAAWPKSIASGLARGEAMNSMGWRSIIMRLLAVAFSLGAWAGIAFGVRQLLG